MSYTKLQSGKPSLLLEESDLYVSIGDNCEAGLNFERIGYSDSCLFRYARADLADINRALANGFVGLFDEIEPTSRDMVRCLRYNIAWHTKILSSLVNGVRRYDDLTDFDFRVDYEKNKLLYLYDKFLKLVKGDKTLCFFYKCNRVIDYNELKKFENFVLDTNPDLVFKIVIVKEPYQEEKGDISERMVRENIPFLAEYKNTHCFSRLGWDQIFEKHPLKLEKRTSQPKWILKNTIWGAIGESWSAELYFQKMDSEVIYYDFVCFKDRVAAIFQKRVRDGKLNLAIYDGGYFPIESGGSFGIVNDSLKLDRHILPKMPAEMLKEAISRSNESGLGVAVISMTESQGKVIVLEVSSQTPFFHQSNIRWGANFEELLSLYDEFECNLLLSGNKFDWEGFVYTLRSYNEDFQFNKYTNSYKKLYSGENLDKSELPITACKVGEHFYLIYLLIAIEFGQKDKIFTVANFKKSGISFLKKELNGGRFGESSIIHYRENRNKSDWNQVRYLQSQMLFESMNKDELVREIKNIADSGYPYAKTVYQSLISSF